MRVKDRPQQGENRCDGTGSGSSLLADPHHDTDGYGLSPRRDMLYLQFGKGRLSGAKGNPGCNWDGQW
ncbi:MAG: hypothetical protein ACXWKP_32190 [Bradyrhizobium sp.]